MKKSIYSDNLNTLLSLLKDLRINAGVKQNELANLLNKPQSFVSKYESGERRLDIIELKNICEVLNIALIDFIKIFEKKINETK